MVQDGGLLGGLVSRLVVAQGEGGRAGVGQRQQFSGEDAQVQAK